MSQRLTIKGQVTVPKNIRDFLGLTSGSSAVEFIIDEDGSVRVQKAQVRKARRAWRTRGEYRCCDGLRSTDNHKRSGCS